MASPTHITSPTARSTVLNGRYAECAFNGLVLLYLFDWRIRANFDYANLTAAGDRWKVNVFLDADWTAEARGYMNVATVSTYISNSQAAGIPQLLTFTGYSELAAGGHKIWEGSCWIKSGEISVPMALTEQHLEVIGTGMPTSGVG
jgi:hypothetical protein